MTDSRPPLRPPDCTDAFGEGMSSRRGGVMFLVVCLLVAFWDLSGRSVYHKDLPRFATIAREMIRSGDWLVPTQYGETYANKPILYVWAVALPSALVGDPTAFTLRFANALALVATAWGAALWGTARSGSKAVGRAAGWMVLTTWFVTELGRVGRPDMLATAASTVAAAFVDRSVLGRGGRRDALWAGLAMGAGLLAKGPVTLLLPLLLIVLPRAAIPWRERLSRGRPLSALSIALAVAALWLVPVTMRDGWSNLGRLLGQVSERVEGRGNHIESPLYYLVEFPMSAAPWTGFYLAAAVAFAFRRVRAALGDGAHVAAAGVALLVFSAVPTKEIRYASILVPPLAVATAACAAHLVARARRADLLAHALRAGGIVALLLAIASKVLLARVDTPAFYVAMPVYLGVSGFFAVRAASRVTDAPGLAGRMVGLALVAAAVAPCVYWSYLGRYLVTNQDQENSAVLAALEPGVPAVILGGTDVPGSLTPDDLYDVGATAGFTKDVARIPSPAASPRETVICLDVQADAVAKARGETPVETLRRSRADGRTLVVLRFGPRSGG